MNGRSAAIPARPWIAPRELLVAHWLIEALGREADRGLVVLRVDHVPALQDQARGRARHPGEGEGDRTELAPPPVARLDQEHLRVVADHPGEARQLLCRVE